MSEKTHYSYHQLKEMIISKRYKLFDSIAQDIDAKTFVMNEHTLLAFVLCSNKYLPFLQSLIEKNLMIDQYLVSYDQEHENLLMKAALHCNQDAIDYLIKNTALGQKKHLHALDKKGGNLLHFACCEGELSFIQYLVENYNLDINVEDNEYGFPEKLSENEEVIAYLENLRQFKESEAEKNQLNQKIKITKNKKRTINKVKI